MVTTDLAPAAGFLGRLSQADLDALHQRMTISRFERGEIIISHLEESRDVFFVLEGWARATAFSMDGKVVSYRDIRRGDIFGEFAAIDGLPRSASVLAMERGRAGRLTHDAFRRLVETQPGFTWALLNHLTTQARWMTNRIFEFSTLVVRERLILELVRLAEEAGVRDGRAIVRPAPTHFDLAARLSTHREAISREISKLTKRGILARHGRDLIVRDIDSLRDLSSTFLDE